MIFTVLKHAKMVLCICPLAQQDATEPTNKDKDLNNYCDSPQESHRTTTQ